MGFSAVLRRMTLRSGQASAVILGPLRDYSAACSVKSPSPSIPLPWVIEGGEVVPKRSLDIGGGEELVGSSYGWMALFNKHSNDLFLSDPLSHRMALFNKHYLFLSDPLSHRRVTLPPVIELPDPDLNLDLDGHGTVWKVVLSSSPDDEECRAMMIFGPAKRVAMYSPGRSSSWNPVGGLYWFYRYLSYLSFAVVHDDLVYLSRKGQFSTVSPCSFDWEKVLLGDWRNVWPRKTIFHTRAIRRYWKIGKHIQKPYGASSEILEPSRHVPKGVVCAWRPEKLKAGGHRLGWRRTAIFLKSNASRYPILCMQSTPINCFLYYYWLRCFINTG